MLQGQSLDNSIALVTGASRGIGAAIALELGKQGATVIGTATTVQGAEQISKILAHEGVKGTGMALDVNDATQIEAVLKTIAEQYGEIGVLVNNAGITHVADDGRDIDDAAGACFHHGTQYCLRHAINRLEVGGDHRIPVIILHAHEQRIARNAGIIDQHTDFTVLLGNRLQHGFDLRGIIDVERHACALHAFVSQYL